MLYEPDSNAKSYTLARPISFPGEVMESDPTLEFLKLKEYDVEIPREGDP